MLLKAAVNDNCGECGRLKREISPEQHGCDQCKKPIVPYENDERLEVVVHNKDKDDNVDRQYKSHYFCSWICVFNFLANAKADYFLSLPYVSFDNVIPGRRGKDFVKLIRKFIKDR